MKIEKILAGGDPRTIKGVGEVVELVISNPKKLQELFECLFVQDEIVRMRAGDALEKICKLHPDRFEPFTERLLTDVSKIDQPSVQWHLAQMLAEIRLTKSQSQRAVNILKQNLRTTTDWIVTNLTIESLAKFVRSGNYSKNEFVKILVHYQTSSHKSVVSRVRKLLREFNTD